MGLSETPRLENLPDAGPLHRREVPTMTCVHLRKLYQLCHDEGLRLHLGDADLVRIVCRQCGEQEVCPSTLTDEYDAKEHSADSRQSPEGDAP